jgi:hypothetical protein
MRYARAANNGRHHGTNKRQKAKGTPNTQHQQHPPNVSPLYPAGNLQSQDQDRFAFFGFEPVLQNESVVRAGAAALGMFVFRHIPPRVFMWRCSRPPSTDPPSK